VYPGGVFVIEFCECPRASSGLIIKGIEIRKDTDLNCVQIWARSNRAKNAYLKKIMKHICRAVSEPDFTDVIWTYPPDSSDPPPDLCRVKIEVCSDSTQELYSVEALKNVEYTEEDAEKTISEITFGQTLSEGEQHILVEVIKKRISSFSRHKGDIGYTTLIEHEIDLTDTKPFKIKPYKLFFAE
jgi:hypothetical protein